MSGTQSVLTVCFADPFWIGIYERTDDSGYSVCKVIFGSEPQDTEVYIRLIDGFNQLRFSQPTTDNTPPPKLSDNPKRRQREAHQQTIHQGIGTKAQQELKAQYEERKCAAEVLHRETKDAQLQRQYELKKEKRKAKHRGH